MIENFILDTKTFTNLSLDENMITITPNCDETALTYNLDTFQITNKQKMLGEWLLQRFGNYYVYFSEDWAKSGESYVTIVDGDGNVTNVTETIKEAISTNK